MSCIGLHATNKPRERLLGRARNLVDTYLCVSNTRLGTEYLRAISTARPYASLLNSRSALDMYSKRQKEDESSRLLTSRIMTC